MNIVRLVSVAAALPVMAFVLLMPPLIGVVTFGAAQRGLVAFLYIVAVWFVMIILTARISKALKERAPDG